MKLDPRLLAQISAIVEAGSYQGAADMLGLTQPALSRGIKGLERRLGQPVFEKLGRRSVPTELGRQLAQQGLSIRRAEEHARSYADAVRSGKAGSLRIGAPPIIAGRFLGKPIGRFLTANANVSVDLRVGVVDELRNMLEIGQVDLLVGPLALAGRERGLHVDQILNDSVGILCRRGHPLMALPQVSAHDLSAYAWVMHSPRSTLRSQTESALADMGLTEISVGVELQSVESVYSILRNSDLLTAMPRRASDPDVSDELVFLDLDHPKLARPIGVISRRTMRVSALQTAFIAMLGTDDEA